MAKRDLQTLSGEIDSDSLCTPSKILDPIYEIYDGMIGTDPCSNPHSIVKARQAYHEFGLLLPWSVDGKAADGYQNHPYSTNEPWIGKMIYEMKVGNLREHIVLCMAAPSTYWWQSAMIKPRTNPRVVMTERLKFLGPDGRPLKDSARFDTALIYYPSRKSRAAKFDRLFRHVARWSTWGR